MTGPGKPRPVIPIHVKSFLTETSQEFTSHLWHHISTPTSHPYLPPLSSHLSPLTTRTLTPHLSHLALTSNLSHLTPPYDSHLSPCLWLSPWLKPSRKLTLTLTLTLTLDLTLTLAHHLTLTLTLTITLTLPLTLTLTLSLSLPELMSTIFKRKSKTTPPHGQELCKTSLSQNRTGQRMLTWSWYYV